VYVVNKRDSYVVVAQLSPEFTARLVDRWQELEAQAAVPRLDDLSTLRGLLLDYTARAEKAQAKIAQDAPKIDFYETHTRPDGNMSFRNFAI
jgi:phage regulator Rha-like protein